MITAEQQKIILLEKELEKLTAQIRELNKRVQFLERENNRRKSEIASKKG